MLSAWFLLVWAGSVAGASASNPHTIPAPEAAAQAATPQTSAPPPVPTPPAPTPPAPTPPATERHADEPAPFNAMEVGPFGDRVDLSQDWLLYRIGKPKKRAKPQKDTGATKTPDPARPDASTGATEGPNDATAAPAVESGPPPAPTGLEFALPGLDDSAWERIDTRKSLVLQGVWGANELWYRTRVHVTPGSRHLALTLSDIGGSYRVYVNGTELGGHGSMSGHGDYLIVRSATYTIPDAVVADGNVTIALHAFVGTVDRTSATLADGISPHSAVFLGPADVLARDQQAYFEHGRAASSSTLTLWGVLLVLAGALALLVRRQPLYPLLVAGSAGVIVSTLLIDYSGSHYMSRTDWLTWPIQAALLVAGLAAVEFARVVAGVKRNWPIRTVEALYVLGALLLFPAAMETISYVVYSVVATATDVLMLLLGLVLLLLGTARRRRDAAILIAATALLLAAIAVWSGLRSFEPRQRVPAAVAHWIVANLRPATLVDYALILGLFAILVVHTVGIVRERATVTAEIEAARTMQQLLLARSSDATPGFAVETAYLPAGELGGDFFLVSATREGDLAAVVGDVSGKGLLAAMRVSMILGVLRREPSREPATVLCSLNEALLAQAEMGFTTACAVRLCPDGRFTVANAGHLPPYLAGESRSVELPTCPALPLGLAAGQRYDVLEGRLRPGERLVLLSDGVPEAKARGGELFGFDRTGALTLRPASEIASTALAFGQEDDITVVTLACVAAPAAPAQPAPPPLPERFVPPPPRVFST